MEINVLLGRSSLAVSETIEWLVRPFSLKQNKLVASLARVFTRHIGNLRMHRGWKKSGLAILVERTNRVRPRSHPPTDMQ